jgi:predicted amidophosphoribosyltransferase
MTKEFDFVGSTVVCEKCRKEFELYDNDLWVCEECAV